MWVQTNLSGAVHYIDEHFSQCPICSQHIDAKFIAGVQDNESPFPQAQICYRCTNKKCQRLFLGLYQFVKKVNNTSYYVHVVAQPVTQIKREFPPAIQTLSPTFIEIYNESYAAEQLSFMQICGVGYRKSLEFLIKDYLVNLDKDNEEHVEKIKKKMLGPCIAEDIKDGNIKAVAARATWLGNDETHYTRKWEDKDVKDLKKLIDLTVYWIDSEELTKQALADMPQGKK